MGRSYLHLNLEERRKIAQWLEARMPVPGYYHIGHEEEPMNQSPPDERMTVEAFETWCFETVPKGRYELSDGRVVAMPPERVGHHRTRAAVIDALRAASQGLSCEVMAHGMAVRINETTQREPDAALRCGVPLPDDATYFVDPVVVVEVTSPSTAQTDCSTKLVDYASLVGLAHYLIVEMERRVVIHYRKGANGFATAILDGGKLALVPPGMVLDLDRILCPA